MNRDKEDALWYEIERDTDSKYLKQAPRKTKCVIQNEQKYGADIVYANKLLLTLNLGHMDISSLKIFISLLGLSRETPKMMIFYHHLHEGSPQTILKYPDNKILTISYKDIKHYAEISYRGTEYLSNKIDQMIKDMGQVTIYFKENHTTTLYPIFSRLRNYKDEQLIELKWNDEAISIIHDIYKDYISFKTTRIMQLKNKYEILMYIFCKRWYTYKNPITIPIADFKHYLDITETKETTRKVKEALKSLQDKGLYTHTMMNKKTKGKEVTHLIFDFTQEPVTERKPEYTKKEEEVIELKKDNADLEEQLKKKNMELIQMQEYYNDNKWKALEEELYDEMDIGEYEDLGLETDDF